MRFLAAAFALCATACLHPPNKQTGYLASGLSAGLGGVLLISAEQRDCSGMDLGDSVGCGVGKQGGTILGISLIAIGALAVVATAVSDAPATP